MHPISQIAASEKTIPCICLARLVRFQPVPSLKKFREGFNTRLSLRPSETNSGQHREGTGCVSLLKTSPLRAHVTSGWKPQRLENSASHLTGALFTSRYLLLLSLKLWVKLCLSKCLCPPDNKWCVNWSLLLSTSVPLQPALARAGVVLMADMGLSQW